MRIARFIYDWPPPWMGLAPGPFEMTRTQAGMGHALTVFCGRGAGGAAPEAIPGVRIVALPRAVKGILLFTSAPVLLVRFLLAGGHRRFDLVHGHAHVPQWYHLWRRVFGGRIPYFFHLHVTFAGREEALLAKGYRFSVFERFGNRVGRISDRWGCRAADHVFATNESVKEEAVRLIGVAPDKVTVVRNGVNADLFRPGPKPPGLMARLGLSPEDEVVLYAGVLNGRKNLAALVEALALLPPAFKLILAGDGPRDYVEGLKARLRALGLEDRARFAGYVAYPDLPDWYSLADVFVLPSLYEGLPKVLLEALACGKPAVVHAGYALDEGLDPFVDKADCASPPDLAAKAREAAERGFKGNHRSYLAEFSWRAIMEKVDAVYARFLPPARRDGS